MLALVDGIPKILTLKEMLNYYLNFQKEIIINRTKFDLKKVKERGHILEGLKIVTDDIDKTISIMKDSKTVQEAREKLEKIYKLTNIQTQATVGMRLSQLTGLEREKMEEELIHIKEKNERFN